ncbi:ATP-binding protein [Pontiellaceae bacterium B12227]|nr:ATP-binding protein [Pontiellaceae bacterium B12227]
MTKKKIVIEAKEDFLERLSSASSINAMAELIWNGVDAGSNIVDVQVVTNAIDGVEEIRIQDYGSGIPYGDVEDLFGNLGESWKKDTGRKYGRALHGKDGEGRFKAFALGHNVTWNTTYSSGNGNQTYQITGESTALIESLSYTDPTPATNTLTGTEVVISNIENSHGSLLGENASKELAKLFAAYLSKYPGINITLNGTTIDPSGYQNHVKEIQLQPITLSNGETAEVTVSIIEWNISTKRAVHLCDGNGVSLHEIEGRFRAPGFDFTAYIKSDHFRELDKGNFLILDDLHPDVETLVSRGKDAIRTHFRKRLAAKQCKIVEKWKKEEVYPFEEKEELTPVEEAERQVFDILGVNLEAYLPKFDEADHNSRKFTFMLMAQALKENPKSVQKIITETLNLKKEAQDDLAALLEKTTFSNIISSASVVANRLNFLTGLENLLFDDETKPKFLERDQLHKILETEAWIFDEEFTLSSSEERLEEVLRKHVGVLGEREDGGTDVDVGDGKRGRIDLQLSRTITPRSGEHDYLVVELKRPTKKIDDGVITQVKKYANAVVNDERFLGVPAKWKFLAVSNEMNEFARNDANQQGKPQGQVWISPNGQVTVWVREWAEVINTARARLQFINASLDYEADRESAREYLHKAHEKFIPEIDKDEESEVTVDVEIAMETPEKEIEATAD